MKYTLPMFSLDDFIRESNLIDPQFNEYGNLLPGSKPGEPMYDRHVAAWEFIEYEIQKPLFSHNFFRDIHRELTRGLYIFEGHEGTNYSGTYRDRAVWIGEGEAEKPYMISSLCSKLSSRMNTLVDTAINDDLGEEEISEMIWVIHHIFQCIHPFIDGNGRTGRLVLNALRLKVGLQPIVIKYDEREEYYSKIVKYRHEHYKAFTFLW